MLGETSEKLSLTPLSPHSKKYEGTCRSENPQSTQILRINFLSSVCSRDSFLKPSLTFSILDNTWLTFHFIMSYIFMLFKLFPYPPPHTLPLVALGLILKNWKCEIKKANFTCHFWLISIGSWVSPRVSLCWIGTPFLANPSLLLFAHVKSRGAT